MCNDKCCPGEWVFWCFLNIFNLYVVFDNASVRDWFYSGFNLARGIGTVDCPYSNPIPAQRIMIVYCLCSDCFGSNLVQNANVCGIHWSYVHAETRCVRTSVALVLTHAVLFFASFSYWSCDYISFIPVWVQVPLFCSCQFEHAHYVVGVLRRSAVERRPCLFWRNPHLLCWGHSHRPDGAGVWTEDGEQQSQWAFGNVDNFEAVY